MNISREKTMRLRRILFLPPLLLFFLLPLAADSQQVQEGVLKISSPVFENSQNIPRRYACDGKNVNPPLGIENVPVKAKSLALIFDDRDAPGGTFVHWILWNIDPGVKEIKEDSVPEGAVQGTNDFKKRSYGGPCPPSRAHRYDFRIYALDTRLKLEPKSRKADLEKAMKGHVVAQAKMTGLYKKNPKGSSEP